MSDIEALLAERAGYAMRGLKNRVAEVDASLAVEGYVAAPDGDVEHAVAPKAEHPVAKANAKARRK